jgi:hypothetical protein
MQREGEKREEKARGGKGRSEARKGRLKGVGAGECQYVDGNEKQRKEGKRTSTKAINLVNVSFA